MSSVDFTEWEQVAQSLVQGDSDAVSNLGEYLAYVVNQCDYRGHDLASILKEPEILYGLLCSMWQEMEKQSNNRTITPPVRLMGALPRFTVKEVVLGSLHELHKHYRNDIETWPIAEKKLLGKEYIP